jgi:hypothetical protein
MTAFQMTCSCRDVVIIQCEIGQFEQMHPFIVVAYIHKGHWPTTGLRSATRRTQFNEGHIVAAVQAFTVAIKSGRPYMAPA